MHQLLAVAYVLEDRIQLAAALLSNPVNSKCPLDDCPIIIADTIKFYSLPELTLNQQQYSWSSVTNQILSLSHPRPTPANPNYFASLFQDSDHFDMMEVDNSYASLLSSQNSSSKYVTKSVSWNTDIGITAISDEIFTNLKTQQSKDEDAGGLETDHPEYKQPTANITSEKLTNVSNST